MNHNFVGCISKEKKKTIQSDGRPSLTPYHAAHAGEQACSTA